MPKIKNRHALKSKDIRQFKSKLDSEFTAEFFTDKSKVETGEYEGLKFLFIDESPDFFFEGKEIFFTLQGIEKYRPKNRYVTVDMGAVKFVTNGADVMAPGIVDADEDIELDSQVWVRDEKNLKALAVGISLMDGAEMKSQNSGKAISIKHWVGDRIWNLVAKSL